MPQQKHEQLCEVRGLQDACSLVPPTTVTTNACLSCWSRVVHGPRISQRMSSQCIWRDVVIRLWRPIKSSTIFLGPTEGSEFWSAWIWMGTQLRYRWMAQNPQPFRSAAGTFGFRSWKGGSWVESWHSCGLMFHRKNIEKPGKSEEIFWVG
jgi:hypothetical protein